MGTENITGGTPVKPYLPKIVIADSLPDSAADLLRQMGWKVDARARRSREKLLHDLKDADGLIVQSNTQVDAELLASAPQLKVIARAGTGVENIDVGAASARGILIINAPGANSVSVAEHTCALMLALGRSIARADTAMKQGQWTKKELVGIELRGKTLGLVGLGRVGQEVAFRARAFGMHVVAHDPYISEQLARSLDVELLTLDALCVQSDFVSLHLPLSATTRRMINAKQLAKFKFGSHLINTSRGDLIDESALADAVESGQICGAGLDVFECEPPIDSRLITLPQVIATPHIAGSTQEAQQLVGTETAAGIRDYLQLGIVQNAVIFPTIRLEQHTRLQPFVNLAEKLGAFVAQLATGRTRTVNIRYYGGLTTGTNEPLVGAVLKGVFQTMLSSTITLINARSVAKGRGVDVVESRSPRPRNFTSLMAVKLDTSNGELWVEGAIFEHGGARIVLLDGVEIEAGLEGTHIVIRNLDEPGVVGAVGSILAECGVNIARFALGRGPAGAVSVISIDDSMDSGNRKLDEGLLDTLRTVPAIKSAQLVRI
ncbi:MAG: phosphoglycerate dehydrogenase [Acidobacteriota bacterium]|nr:phosphoglycerate dehydrogenase [Acidobacteriota bacterium]